MTALPSPNFESLAVLDTPTASVQRAQAHFFWETGLNVIIIDELRTRAGGTN